MNHSEHIDVPDSADNSSDKPSLGEWLSNSVKSTGEAVLQAVRSFFRFERPTETDVSAFGENAAAAFEFPRMAPLLRLATWLCAYMLALF